MGGSNSEALAISDDALTIAGMSENLLGRPIAVVWDAVPPCDIEITAIDGLRSNSVGGFNAETNAAVGGRLFVDTDETSGHGTGGLLNNPNGQRARLEVTACSSTGTGLPSHRIRWQLFDPDDPAGPIIDRGGPGGGDNTGKAFEAGSEWFEQADPSHPIVASLPSIDPSIVAVSEDEVIGQVGNERHGNERHLDEQHLLQLLGRRRGQLRDRRSARRFARQRSRRDPHGNANRLALS